MVQTPQRKKAHEVEKPVRKTEEMLDALFRDRREVDRDEVVRASQDHGAGDQVVLAARMLAPGTYSRPQLEAEFVDTVRERVTMEVGGMSGGRGR